MFYFNFFLNRILIAILQHLLVISQRYFSDYNFFAAGFLLLCLFAASSTSFYRRLISEPVRREAPQNARKFIKLIHFAVTDHFPRPLWASVCCVCADEFSGFFIHIFTKLLCGFQQFW